MNHEYEVKQIEPAHYRFTRTPQKHSETVEVEVFLLDGPDGPPLQSLLKTKEHQFDLTLEVDFRPYFLIKSTKEVYKIAERTLPVEGMNNFRDMGGYTTQDGKRVKWGRLYRSDHIHNATTKGGLEYLKNLDIKAVVDYRSDNEISKYPNPVFDNGISTYHLDPSAHIAELAAQFQSSKENEDINLINKIIEQRENGSLINHSDVVNSQYQNFVNGSEAKKAFGKMLAILADSESGSVVQHCRGGKDRTGFGAMLVLGILGVSNEDLVADYLITGKNREERNRIKMEGYRKLTSDETVLNHLYSFIDTKPEFIKASIDSIISQYSTIEHYVLSELGVSKEMVEKLKRLYLE